MNFLKPFIDVCDSFIYGTELCFTWMKCDLRDASISDKNQGLSS